MEKYYVFLKGNRVENIFLFSSEDVELAQQIVNEQGYTSFVWIDESIAPERWSTYDEQTKKFTPPTTEYLCSIGIIETAPKLVDVEEVTPTPELN